jgi:hypothetical protein
MIHSFRENDGTLLACSLIIDSQIDEMNKKKAKKKLSQVKNRLMR